MRILECANLKGKDDLPNRLTANDNINNNNNIIYRVCDSVFMYTCCYYPVSNI